MTYLKMIMLICSFTVIAAHVLSLRNQRFVVNHQVARLHQQMDGARQSLWESQVRVAEQLKPAALEHKLSVAKMKLEPISTSPSDADGLVLPSLAARRWAESTQSN